MLLIGIDDTDIQGSEGTNQLAKAIVAELAGTWQCERIVRHQLLDDPQIPCTSKNGSASILLSPRSTSELNEQTLLLAIHRIREVMKQWFVKGSDPGLCVSPLANVSDAIVQFGYRCQFEVVRQSDALQLADEAGIHLEGLGGTNGGIIGALAAVGLGSKGNDGRVVQIGDWSEDLVGRQTVAAIQSRGVKVTNIDTDELLNEGVVLLDHTLRPNLRNNQIVLFVQKDDQELDAIPEPPTYHEVKLP